MGMANTLYIDLANGSNTTGTGSTQSPLLTIAAALTLLGSQPGTLNVQGICRTPVSLSGLQGVTVQPWKDAAPLQFRLDRQIAGPWTAVGNGSFTVNIGTGKSVAGVVKGFDTNVTRYGQHFGYLTPAADAAGTATQGTWFYATGTGLLYVNVDASNPGLDVMWCEGGANAFSLINCQDCIVDRFVGYNALDPTPGLGYLFIGSGSRNTVRIDNIDGYGYHAAGFVAGGGLLNQDNIIEGCDRALIAGCNVGTSGATTLVHYQYDTNTGANAVGRKLEIRLNNILKLDQTQVRADRNLAALYSHSNTGNRMAGVVWSNIRVFQDLAATGARTFMDAGDTNVPATVTDASLYDARAVNCQGYGLASNNVTASFALVGCFLRFDRTGAIATDSSRMAFDPRGNSNNKALLLSGCDVSANLDTVGGTPTLLRSWTNFRLSAVNSTIYDSGTGNSGDRSIIASANNTTEQIRMHKCVLGYAAATNGLRRLVLNDAYTAGTGTRIFTDCAYVRIAGYSGAAWTQAEFAAAFDSAMLVVASNPFQDYTVSGKPTRASTLYTTVNRTTGIKADGLFGQPNIGRIGAWQFGQMPGLTFSGATIRSDLPMHFVSLFGNTGSTRNNNRGYANDFFNDPYNYMKVNAGKVIALGIKHICIAHWHGQNVVSDNTTDSAYYTGNPESMEDIPMRARNGILRFIDENPDIQFSLYISPYPRNKYTGSLVPRQRMFDMAGEDGYEAFKEFIELWARPNLRLFWSDAVGAAVDENIDDGTFNIATLHDRNRAKFESIGLKMGGEVWPQNYTPTLGYRPGQVDRGPWLVLGANVGNGEDLLAKETARGTQYIVNTDAPGDGYHSIAVGTGFTADMAEALMARGLVVGTTGEQSDEVIRFIAQQGDGQPPARVAARRSMLRAIVSLDLLFNPTRDTFKQG